MGEQKKASIFMAGLPARKLAWEASRCFGMAHASKIIIVIVSQIQKHNIILV